MPEEKWCSTRASGIQMCKCFLSSLRPQIFLLNRRLFCERGAKHEDKPNIFTYNSAFFIRDIRVILTDWCSLWVGLFAILSKDTKKRVSGAGMSKERFDGTETILLDPSGEQGRGRLASVCAQPCCRASPVLMSSRKGLKNLLPVFGTPTSLFWRLRTRPFW